MPLSSLVTRNLGVSYLWVDLLCILQDSVDDWPKESAVMGDIYANALLVITADAAIDSDSGFLHPRVNSLRFIGANDNGIDETSIVVARSDRVRRAVARSDTKCISRLHTRGWAFQEYYLAARKLIFGQDEIAWECNSVMRCECTDGSRLETRYSFNPMASSDWKMVVEGYTARHISKAQDRLPATSGIAARYHSQGEKDEYIAGMWRGKLMDLLLWNVDSSRLVPTNETEHRSWRQEGYQAPSWSWASVIRPIVFYSGEVDRTCEKRLEVIRVEYSLVSANMYGALKSVELTISMFSCGVRFLKDMDGDDVMLLYSLSFNPCLLSWLEDVEDAIWSRLSSKLKSVTSSRFRIAVDCNNPGPDAPLSDGGSSATNHIWALPLHHVVPDVDGDGVESEISPHETYRFGLFMAQATYFVGLVLRVVDEGVEKVQRVGMCRGNRYAFGLDGAEAARCNDRFDCLSKFLGLALERRIYVMV